LLLLFVLFTKSTRISRCNGITEQQRKRASASKNKRPDPVITNSSQQQSAAEQAIPAAAQALLSIQPTSTGETILVKKVKSRWLCMDADSS
jgi:hypothetical protein